MEDQIIHVPGQRVEVFYAGWNNWYAGTVESVGRYQGFPCARVLMDGRDEVSVYRLDQMRAYEGLGGLFALMGAGDGAEGEGRRDASRV